MLVTICISAASILVVLMGINISQVASVNRHLGKVEQRLDSHITETARIEIADARTKKETDREEVTYRGDVKEILIRLERASERK